MTHKTIMRLDETLTSVRILLRMWATLPEAQRQTAVARTPELGADAAAAAAQAGQAVAARNLLERRAAEPPASEPADLTWAVVLGAGLTGLGDSRRTEGASDPVLLSGEDLWIMNADGSDKQGLATGMQSMEVL